MQALVLVLQRNENIHHLLVFRSSVLSDFSKALKSLALAFSLSFNDKLRPFISSVSWFDLVFVLPDVFAIPDGEDFTWAVYRATMPKYQFIGDIALRLEASPCSEAECERMISRKKLVKNPVRMRSKDDLVKARMILSSIH